MRVTLHHPNILALVAIGLGIAADRLFYGRLPGISFPIFVLLCLVSLALLSRAEARPAAPANRWLGVAALLFAGLTAVRAEPTLVFLNVCATLLLLLLHVGLFREVSLARLPAYEYLFRTIGSGFNIGLRPALFGFDRLRGAMPSGARLQSLAPVGRGLALAVPVVGVFTVLLVMADAVFASVMGDLLRFRLPFDISWLTPHLLLVGFAGWVCAGALLTALRDDHATAQGQATGDEPVSYGWLGCVEAITVLGCVDLLFAGFTTIQAAYLFGGLDTLEKTGMTYADYARRGFFELVAVAMLSIGLAWGLTTITRRDGASWQRLAFTIAAGILALLTLGMIASAFQRMWLYEQAYGFTHLRIYTHTFMIWLGVLLALFVAALLAERPRWFTFGGFVSALLVLGALTLANPEAWIVKGNVSRYVATGTLAPSGLDADPVESEYGEYRPSRELDSAYLTRLSPDATPALIEALPLLTPEDQQDLRFALSEQRDWLDRVDQEGGWLSWHVARMQARAALEADKVTR